MPELLQTARRLWRAPGFTLLTVLTLAIGIGATTAVFSVVNSVLIQPLPYPDADRLIAIWHRVTFQGVTGDNGELSAPIYFAYAEHNETLEAFGVYDITRRVANVTGSGDPEQVGTFVVTLKSGKTLNGAKMAEDAASLTFADNQGVKHVLQRKDIDDVQPSPLSIMPDGLEQRMSVDEFVDLIAFLTNQK